MTNTLRNDHYRSAKTLSYLAIGFLCSLLFCFASNVILSFAQMFFSEKNIDLATGENVSIPYLLIGLVTLLYVPLFIATVVFFLIWEHRSFKNLAALQAQNLEFSPGWSVGWWFVPFANLVKPYQAMTELWNESDPDFDPELGFLSSSSSAPQIMVWWWALFIISNISMQISSKMSDSTIADISVYFPVALIIASVLRGVDAFLIITIIKNITRRQELRFQKLGDSNQFAAPPPPPNF